MASPDPASNDPNAAALSDAALRQAVANAELAETQVAQAKLTLATSGTTQYAALVPDLSKVTPSSLTASTGSPLFADATAYAALRVVAEAVVAGVEDAITNSESTESTGTSSESHQKVRLLVTSDTALASSEAVYRQLRDGVNVLNKSVLDLLDKLKPQPEGPQHENIVVAAAAGAVASAIPGVLSLFAAQRTIASSEASPDDVALAATLIECFRVARVTKSWEMAHDSIRLLPVQSDLQNSLRALATSREALVAHSLEPGIDTVRTTTIAAAISGIDQFVSAATATPSGATSSPLMTALSREQLDSEGPDGFTHVLVASMRAGAANGTTEHRMFGKDKFMTVGSITVSYFLLDLQTRRLRRADTVTRTATGSGTIGARLTLYLADETDLHHTKSNGERS